MLDHIRLPGPPEGLAISPDDQRLIISCPTLDKKIYVFDTANPKPAESILAGHNPSALVVSPDGKTLYVCNRFDNDVSVIDLGTQSQTHRIPVQREPCAADVTKDGKYLLVANHLPSGRANAAYCGAVVSVIDAAAAKLVKELRLPNGSGSLHGLRVSPDGKYAAVTHLVANFKRPALRLFPDWINANALTLIDVAKLEILGTVLLDDRGKGAANPWGIAWSVDGATLVVTHAGTHELSIIDFPVFLQRLLDLPAPIDPLKLANPSKCDSGGNRARELHAIFPRAATSCQAAPWRFRSPGRGGHRVHSLHRQLLFRYADRP